MDENQKIKVVIEDVITKNIEAIEPIIAQFANGNLSTQNIECGLFRNASQKAFRRQRQRVLCAKTKQLSYAGKNFGESNSSCVKEQKFLALLDKRTNRMKLIECSSFLLHPITDDVNVKNAVNEKSRTEFNQESIAEFGGKYAKKKYAKSLANKININEMSVLLSNTLKTNVAPLEAITKQDQFWDVLPPCDKLASDASKVYLLESIVSDNTLLLLYDQVSEQKEEIEKAAWISLQYKFNTMSIKFITDEDENMRHCCASLYSEYLIQLLKINRMKLNSSKYILQDCPNIVEDEIHRKYCAGKFPKRNQSAKDKDKLVCHILVLCLLINGLQFHIDVILRSLGYDRERLLNICKCIGATFNVSSGYMILKLPLIQMKEKKERKKRK